MNQGNTDYKKLLTEVIQKQMVILGPAITLAKARNVKGLMVGDDGTVSEVSGPPQEVIQSLIDEFVQLSGLIVKKTMEPLLANFPDGIVPGQEPPVTPPPQPNLSQPQPSNPPPPNPSQSLPNVPDPSEKT